MSEAVSDLRQSPLTWEGDRAPLAKALVAAQKATDAVKKASTNSHFNNKYADLAVVVEAVVPALNEAGVAVIQSPASDGVLVAVTTVLLHESGASVTSTLHMRPTKNDPQGVGSAITYARRYALLAMTGAAPEDDDGNAASKPQERQQDARRHEPAPPTLASRADRLEATLKAAKPEQIERAWFLAQGLRDELAEGDPDRLAALRKIYEFRAPTAEKEAA